VAQSHVVVSGNKATLVGTITNTTGFDVYYASQGPSVAAFDVNGEHVVLNGDFSTRPKEWPDALVKVLPPKGTVSYRSIPVALQQPYRPWQSWWFNPIVMFNTYKTQLFCSQRSVPAYQTVN
jgi:hypothetical protein